MRIRRIGRNELAAIQVALAYTDAQKEYHARDWNGDGVMQYATQRPVVAGQARRPVLGVAAGRAGKPARRRFADAKPGQPYHGYLYRILTAQGKDAPGGARAT